MGNSCIRPTLAGLGMGGLLKSFISTLVAVALWVNLSSIQPDRQTPRRPRTVPYIVPLLRSSKICLVSFLHASFWCCSQSHVARRSCRGQLAIRVALLKDDLYLVHGAKYVAELFPEFNL
jgi:hypothetical protein